MTLRVAQPWSRDLVRFFFLIFTTLAAHAFLFSSRVKVTSEDSSSFDILFCSLLLVWHDALQNVLRDLRDCMSGRLSDATLPKRCV